MIKAEKETAIPKKKISEADLSACVNSDKIRRAKLAVFGGGKPGVYEIDIANKLRNEYEGDALVMKVYEGMSGLVNPARAAKNRENEKKAATRRASR